MNPRDGVTVWFLWNWNILIKMYLIYTIFCIFLWILHFLNDIFALELISVLIFSPRRFRRFVSKELFYKSNLYIFKIFCSLCLLPTVHQWIWWVRASSISTIRNRLCTSHCHREGSTRMPRVVKGRKSTFINVI